MIKSVLIANRGEIACRIIRTAKRMGIHTIAIYSDADTRALHVKQADEAWHLGAAPASESYLCSEKIITIAKQSGADAIHPGYGFLSENAAFVEACQNNDIIFIGPDTYAIEKMGSKSAAKTIMEQANIPLVPGYHGDKQSLKELQQQANAIGYPLLIKAVAGGGGKGMRVVDSPKKFAIELAGAKREGLSSFANEKVLLEKYLSHPRHVEVQVFCDRHGNGIYLGDRDCSVQRRHQKVIEEAPAPRLSAEIREAMGTAAVSAAKAINYVGAGTVEFLLDSDNNFYFMEMNTRLQVEHPVTEMIYDEDLVAWQINIADNQTLPLCQNQIEYQGHAFEARIYAENPWQNFQPSTGTIMHLKEPTVNTDVRIDTGVCQGDEISPFYDPMIAKLVVYGENREQALAKLRHSLRQYQIAGISTNIDFLHHLASLDAFATAQLHTGIIDQHQEQLQTRPYLAIEEWVPLASLAVLHSHKPPNTNCAHFSMRLNQPSKINMSFTIIADDNTTGTDSITTNTVDVALTIAEPLVIKFTSKNKPAQQITFCDLSPSTSKHESSNSLVIAFEKRLIKCNYVCIDNQLNLFTAVGKIDININKACLDDYGQTDNHLLNDIRAPMNGNLIACNVKLGQYVQQGEPLMVVEAMKMEHTIYAPNKGEVTEIYYSVGDMVTADQPLLHLQ